MYLFISQYCKMLTVCYCPAGKWWNMWLLKMAFLAKHRQPLGNKMEQQAGATRWLSHGETSERLIAQFSCLIDALDGILGKGADQEVKGVHDELEQPDTVLYLLLLSDVLGEIASKFTKLKRSIDEFKSKDGQLFCQDFWLFLQISKEKMELAQRLWGNNLIQTSEEEIDIRIKESYHIYKIPFLETVLWELDLAFPLSNLPCIGLFQHCFRFWYRENNQVYKCLKRILWSTTAVYF